jgi:hypothetical protein
MPDLWNRLSPAWQNGLWLALLMLPRALLG